MIFEGGYGCTNSTCHDSAFPKKDLDLEHDVAYEQLLGTDGLGAPSYDFPYLKRVEPGNPDSSYLYIKLAAKTFPGLSFVVDPGTAMPSGGLTALSQDHLEAVRLWIHGGAPRDGVVTGTQSLLGTCLPPPTPLKIPPPDAPPAGTGVQLVQTPWPLKAKTPTTNGEDEICMATYYDLSALVPDSAKIPCPDYLQTIRSCSNDPSHACTTDGDCGEGICTAYLKNANNDGRDCFAYDHSTLFQDPQSHHSIIQLYTGGALPHDPGWQEWTRKIEPSASAGSIAIGSHGSPSCAS